MADKELNKFFVLKNADLKQFLDKHDKDEELLIALQKIVEGIKQMRVKQGKNPDNNYIVCNQDEPYADDVWDLILQGEDKKISYEDLIKSNIFDRR